MNPNNIHTLCHHAVNDPGPKFNTRLRHSCRTVPAHLGAISTPRRNRIGRGREEERKNSFLWTSMEEKEERDYSRKPVPPGPQDQFQNYGQAHSIAPPTFSSGQVHRTLKTCGIDISRTGTLGAWTKRQLSSAVPAIISCLFFPEALLGMDISPSLAGVGSSYVYACIRLLRSGQEILKVWSHDWVHQH